MSDNDSSTSATPAGTAATSGSAAASATGTSAVPAWELLWAVGDPVRWAVLRELLAGQPLTVQELAARTRNNPNPMGKHLKILLDAGAVTVVTPPDTDGRKTHYTVPEKFRRTDADGQPVIDYGVCVLRFP